MRESDSSSEGSATSGSSTDISYKRQFEKEKEKCTQLQVKLWGYHSIASQCPTLIKENNKLKQEIKRLKELKEQEKDLSQLSETPHQNGNPTSSSASFLDNHFLGENNQEQVHNLSPHQNCEAQRDSIADNLSLGKSQLLKPVEGKGQNLAIQDLKQLPSEAVWNDNTLESQAPTHLLYKSTPSVHQTVLTPINTLGFPDYSNKYTEMDTQKQNDTNLPLPWGEGARPKNSNVHGQLLINQEEKEPLASQLKKSCDATGPSLSDWLKNSGKNDPASVPDIKQITNTEKLEINQELNGMKILSNPCTFENSVETNQNRNSETLPILKPEMKSLKLDDLMSFPSSSNTNGKEQPTTKKQYQVVSCPTDEQGPQLASQAHSMVAKFKSGSPTPAGMSSMLYEFAVTAAGMEKKITEYQALIQRQQVQLQSLSQINCSEEHQRLKEENKNLLTLLRNQLSMPLQNEQLMPKYGDEQKIEELSRTNEQLFKANKEWHNKWQQMQQNSQEEKKSLEKQIKDLKGQVISFTAQEAKLTAELAALDTQEQEAKAAKSKTIHKNFELNQDKLDLSRELELMKAQVDDLMRLKRRQEAEIYTLKSQLGSQVQPQTAVGGESVILKQQLAVFHEDFQKEKQDRTAAEARCDRLRKERDAARLEQMHKMKKMQAMLTTKDEDISRKNRQITDLQAQVTSLRKEIHQERRKNQVANSQPVLYPTGGPRTNMIATALSLKDEQLPRHTYPISTRQLSPEHLPNAWRCRECTYINFPERTVCDICGWHNVRGGSLNGELYTSGLPEVNSGEDYFIRTPSDVPDLVETG